MKYHCRECKKDFDSLRAFYFDFLTHIDFYKCEKCEENKENPKIEKFKKRSEYIAHMKDVHNIQGNGLYHINYMLLPVMKHDL